jgi:ubiquinone/menaquinone biosynthesis C-methylase UbiE
MSFSSFFSQQARKPAGLFGRFVMSVIFNKGNADLNGFVNEVMAVQKNDNILEIGFGTGQLMHKMAEQIDGGRIEGVDFSSTMVSMAQKRNKKHIRKGKVTLVEGNFDMIPYEKARFSKVCTVNTIYFWPEPEKTARKIADVIKPGGKFVVAFGDKEQLKQKQLNKDVFNLYSKEEVKDLLKNNGFSGEVGVKTKTAGNSVLHCGVAMK